MSNEKKTWTSPKLVVHGNVYQLTGTKPKDIGVRDDLLTGISE